MALAAHQKLLHHWQTYRAAIALLCAIGVSSCAGQSLVDSGQMQTAECMVSILRSVPNAQDVRTGTAYEAREGYEPTVKYTFVNPAGRHRVEIRIGGNRVIGYGYFQREIPHMNGNPVTPAIQDEWFEKCRADALAYTS